MRDDESTEVVFIARDYIEADIVKGVLESEGIRACVVSNTAQFRGFLQPEILGENHMQIIVPESDADRARYVIEQSLAAGMEDALE